MGEVGEGGSGENVSHVNTSSDNKFLRKVFLCQENENMAQSQHVL